MRVTYRHIRPLTLMYTRSMGPYSHSCEEAWTTLSRWLDRHGLRRRVKQAYGLFRDDPATTKASLLRFDACVPMVADIDTEPTEGVSRQTFGFGTYAVHTHVGPHEETGGLFSQLHRDIVPRRGLSVDHERPFVAIYLNDPLTTRAPYLRTELCVPVLPICMPLAGNDDADEVDAIGSIGETSGLRIANLR